MFGYFGAKHGNAHRYQPPRHDVIVEPFAGAAGYACYWLTKYPTTTAVLIEKDIRIVETWQRILSHTPDEIMAWPTPVQGSLSTDLTILGTQGHSPLASVNPNVVSSRNVASFPSIRQRIAYYRGATGDRITVVHGDYREAPDIAATWYVDPPYQHQGHLYRLGSEGIDYKELGEWCRTRNGQTIVCEAAPADWLPFKPFYTLTSTAKTQGTELVWESDPTPTLFD